MYVFNCLSTKKTHKKDKLDTNESGYFRRVDMNGLLVYSLKVPFCTHLTLIIVLMFHILRKKLNKIHKTLKPNTNRSILT